MEKNYLRYVSQWHGGVIASPRCNVALDPATGEAVCGSVRDVVAWNLRTGERARRMVRGDEGGGVATSPLDDGRGEVCCVAAAADGSLACAYVAGAVRVWRRDDFEAPRTFGGHAAAVGALRWCPHGATLVSGGANGDALLFDVVAGRASCRLRGHRAAITDVACAGDWAGSGRRLLVSTARDGLIKAWDVGLSACVATFTGAGGGVAVGVDVDAAGGRCVTGAGDRELRLWSIDADDEAVLSPLGAVKRRAMEPAQELRFAAPGVLCVLAHGRTLEVYALRGGDAAAARHKRRVKRRRERGLLGGDDAAPTAADELELVALVESEHRLRSFAVLAASAAAVTVVVATRNNVLETHVASLAGAPAAGAKRKAAREVAPAAGAARAVALPGHRSAVRAVAVSADGEAVASCAQQAVKVWRAGGEDEDAAPRLLRTFDSKKTALACCFLPGNAALAVGTKDGRLLVCDVVGATVSEATDAAGGPAHAGAVFAVVCSTSALDDGACLVTAGADPEVKRWTVADGAAPVHEKTLDVGEECLAACFARDARGKRDGFVCVATLDSVVRVVYADSFKFKVALYGHALNCLCLAGSSDGKMLATGGADKTLKLWGLEFGDLRRSVLAHEDAVTCVAWVRGTHYALTGSKDGAIKQWDCDRQDAPFVQSFKKGHAAEVWGLCVSFDGSRVFTGGADRSLRCWARTDEPVFAAEEQDALLDATLDRLGDGLPPDADDGDGGALVPARAAPGAAKGAERLAEALELAQGEAAAAAAALAKGAKPPPPSRLMLGLKPAPYAMLALSRLSTADLEPALLVLPVDLVAVLLGFLAEVLTADGDSVDVEVVSRAAVFALQLHHRAVAAHEPLRRPLRDLKAALRRRLDDERHLFGRNLAAVRVAGLRAADATPEV